MAKSESQNTFEGTGSRRLLYGLWFDALRMNEVVAQCRTALSTRRPLLIGVLNAAKLVHLQRNSLLKDSVLDCTLLLADGQSIVWASRLLRRPLPERIAGIDLFAKLLALANEEKRSVYLLGAKTEILDRLEQRVQEQYPKLKIVGRHHGYFEDSDSKRIAAAIRESGADMLFLGMSTPKKELFLREHGRTLNVPILHGVGGSFDVLAGAVRRAPISWQRLGLEWAFRLIQEPRRMWRRYLATNTGFILLTCRELLRSSPDLQNAHARTIK